MAIYGINQHGSQMYINSIDGSDKLNVVKENGSIDSGSNGISDNSNSMPGDFADNHNSRNNAPTQVTCGFRDSDIQPVRSRSRRHTRIATLRPSGS